MRRFYAYGPVNSKIHGAVLRRPPNLFGRGKPLAQTGFFTPGHCPASVAPLAQTRMRGMTHLSKAVAPGQAGRAAPTGIRR